MEQKQVWNSLAQPWKKYRTRVWPETKDFLRSHDGMVLDLGCGSGRNFETVKGRIVGIDFAENMLYHARDMIIERKLKAWLACGNITKLPFKDKIFDACIFVSTLQCIRGKGRRLKALKELRRVMKKGAEVLVTCWNREQPRFNGKREGLIPWASEDKTYMRYYYLFYQKELEKLLQSAGFEIVSICGSESRVFNLFPRNIIAIAKKV